MVKEYWIQDAVNPNKKGALRKTLCIKKGETIPKAALKKAEKSKNPKTRKRAVLASTLSKMRK